MFFVVVVKIRFFFYLNNFLILWTSLHLFATFLANCLTNCFPQTILVFSHTLCSWHYQSYMGWGQLNSGIRIDGQFWNCSFLIGIDKFGFEVCYKKLNLQINLPINFNSEIFLPWHSYLEFKLLAVGTRSR